MHTHKDELVIEIDDQIELLIKEINASPNTQQQDAFINSFQHMLIDQLMGPFGLTRAMFDDRDGGAITSLHNFEKGVVANDADAQRHENWQRANQEKFERGDYDDRLDELHDDMKSADGKYYDAYKEPGSEMPEGPRTEARDHVVSASEIERSSRGQLAQTREERVETATQDDNIVLTAFNMNSSKGEDDLMVWAAKPSTKDPSKTNAEYYELDPKAVADTYAKAKKAVDGDQKKAVFIKQGQEFLVEGGKAAGKLALRQILGLLLKDLVQDLVQDVRYLVREGFNGAASLLEMVKARIEATLLRIREKWAEYLQEGASAGIAGFVSTLVTLIINSFVTTAKNLVVIIREAVLSIVRAIKMIVAPPPHVAPGDIAFEVMKILSAALTLSLGIMLEEVIQKALEAIPLLLPFAATLAPVITGIITGTLTLFTVLAFDRLKDFLAFRNKQLADIHRGQTVGFLKIKQTVLILDGAYQHIIITTETLRTQFALDWEEVKEAKQTTQRRLDNYRQSVNSLDDLLEQF
ncbi:hypothetical protein SAMN05216601_102259 [Ectopseudomonas composti]|uniref:Uncharacterized protein n=1 Tax=Ectopseudomonas composti TaxID=658457 RepID=A0A1I5K839_9GAMM|nr:EI24 domain-containing protein [Pseudomonas composti]SFO81157.1 hypothetical protein SAMN05216601_102259 [Pseudomonas composti]